MASSSDHTIVLVESGEVYTFGEGSSGQLGHGAEGEYHESSPILLATLEFEQPHIHVPIVSMSEENPLSQDGATADGSVLVLSV